MLLAAGLSNPTSAEHPLHHIVQVRAKEFLVGIQIVHLTITVKWFLFHSPLYSNDNMQTAGRVICVT